MAEPPTETATETAADSGDLDALGYRQELHRSLGPFASFCSGFSFVSILTTVFELFALGYGFGGPAFFWTWPLVFAGQFAVCLVFAELAARYPIAGAIYQWSRRVSTDPLGWFAGWLMLLGYIVSVAAIAIALQAVLPPVWSGFQLYGTDTSPTSHDGAVNAIVLGSICIAVCAVISSFGVTKMAALTRIGVTCEIVGIVAVLAFLFAHAERGPQVVFSTLDVQGAGAAYLPAFLASILMAAYVMYGFDSAAELSEETNDPRRTAPLAITRCMLVSAVGGGLLLLATLMAAPDLRAPELATDGVAWVVTAQLGDTVGRIVLAVVAISIFSAALAISASATRVMFSMARDGLLPFARPLARVSLRTGTPLLPGVVVALLSIGVLLLNLGQSGVFASVTSVSVVIVYLAYLLVTVPLLWQRLRRHPELSVPQVGYFSLGRWGLPVNVVAVVFGVFLLVDVAWPRPEVYDPDGGHWYLQYSSLLITGGALVLGALAYTVMRRQQTAAPARAGSRAGG